MKRQPGRMVTLWLTHTSSSTTSGGTGGSGRAAEAQALAERLGTAPDVDAVGRATPEADGEGAIPAPAPEGGAEADLGDDTLDLDPEIFDDVLSAASQAFDLVIVNGRVVDGTGAPWFRADVGVTGDRITAIGNLSGARAVTRIDAAGQVVAPANGQRSRLV